MKAAIQKRVVDLDQLPEYVRTQLHFQHDVLRALIGRLADAAERTLRDDAAVQELRDAQRTLHAVLDAHFRQEEALAPLFRERLHEDHYKALATLRRLANRDPKRSAAASRRLASYMLEAITAEERDVLSAVKAARGRASLG